MRLDAIGLTLDRGMTTMSIGATLVSPGSSSETYGRQHDVG